MTDPSSHKTSFDIRLPKDPQSKCNKFITKRLFNLNILWYSEEGYGLINKYLSNFKCKIELKIGACIYYIHSSNDIPCQLNRISGLVSYNINNTKTLYLYMYQWYYIYLKAIKNLRRLNNKHMKQEQKQKYIDGNIWYIQLYCYDILY